MEMNQQDQQEMMMVHGDAEENKDQENEGGDVG